MSLGGSASWDHDDDSRRKGRESTRGEASSHIIDDKTTKVTVIMYHIFDFIYNVQIIMDEEPSNFQQSFASIMTKGNFYLVKWSSIFFQIKGKTIFISYDL
jgi:hypothetical protein